MSWSAVACLVLLAVGLHIHQHTKFLFLARLILEIWESKNKKVGVAYTLDAPSRKIYVCSPSICKCQQAHQILTS